MTFNDRLAQTSISNLIVIAIEGYLVFLAALIVGAFAIGLIVPAPYHLEVDTTPLTTPSTTCYEDMPCWDCQTMGNRICGVTP